MCERKGDSLSLDEAYAKFEHKMDCLICDLSNGMISKSHCDNALIKAVIEEQFDKAYETELAQAANDLEAMKLYASNVRDLLVKVYGEAVWLLESIPDEDKTAGDLKDMDELYRRIHELGIEI